MHRQIVDVDKFTINVTVPAGVHGTVDVLVTAGGQSNSSPEDYYTYTDTGWKGIISATSTDQVALFNTTTNTFDTLIPITDTSMASVITPDGACIYTANTSLTGVSVIDAATSTIITTIAISVGPGASAKQIILWFR